MLNVLQKVHPLKKHALYLSVLILVLNPTFNLMANPAEKNLSSLLMTVETLISQPAPGFIPHQNSHFMDFVYSLNSFSNSQTLDVYRVLRLTVEHYKQKLDNPSAAINTTQIHTYLSMLITSSKGYFERSKNELALQYFENLDLFLAEATRLPLSHKQYSDGSSLTREEAEKRANEIEAEKKARVDSVYLDFVVRLRNSSQNNKSLALRVLMDEANKLKKAYTDAVSRNQPVALIRLKEYAIMAYKFNISVKNEFGIKYFEKLVNYVETEKETTNTEMTAANKRALDFLTAEQEKIRDTAERRALLAELADFTQAPGNPLVDKTWTTIFKGAQIEFSYKEIHIESSSDNVLFMIDKGNVKRIFTVNVLKSSPQVREAILIATSALLTNPGVYGVYFENQLKLPSDLNLEKYEIKSLGRGRILLRQRSLVCSALFS